ncbi:hypothetical protein GC170_12450 [bacterium]|nr:hypothetical protein [bacterium]
MQFRVFVGITSILIGFAAESLRAADLLDNTNQKTEALLTGGSGVYGTNRKAMIFSVSQNIELTNVALGLRDINSNPNTTKGTIALYAVDGSNNPTTSIAEITYDSISFSTAQYVDFALSGMSLTAGNSYALVVLDFTATIWSNLSQAPVGSNGVSFVEGRFSTDGGTSWNSSSVDNAIYLQGTPVPEPSAVMLASVAAMILLRSRKLRCSSISCHRSEN